MHKILSIHWGYSIGGVGKYASIIDDVTAVKPDIEIDSIIILSPSSHVDHKTLKTLRSTTIINLKSKLDLSWIVKLSKIIKEKKPDLLMSHGFNGHFVNLIQKYILRHKIPAICSYHGQYHATTSIRKLFGIIYNKLTEFYIRNCAIGTIAVADYCKTYLIDKGVKANSVTVIHNGIEDIEIPVSDRETLRNEWNVSDDDILLGIASRLDPVKGIEYLLDAFVNIAEKHTQLKLVVIGTGTLEENITHIVKQHELTHRVIFTGFRDDIASCLTAMDIFVLPSLAEYHSIALLEAMRASKVIVSTDVGGNTESVRDHEEGIIVPSMDSEAISKAVELLIGDKELSSRLSAAARQRFLSHFTIDKTVSNTAEWLNTQVKNVV